jgi:type II secretory pathway pseudopilin PulG
MSSSKQCTIVGIIIAAVLFTAAVAAATLSQQNARAFIKGSLLATRDIGQDKTAAPIATSGDNNVYVAWPSNKTGNNEVMFKASTDGGKTFSDKMNLSNSTKSESVNVQIAAAGNNVYVSWWETNQTSNEPVLRVSNDNGKTFGEKIMLSAQ